MASLIEAFETLRYQRCDNGEVEVGFEKIALYGSDAEWGHAAKQLPDGRWSSKCGDLDDIAHNSVADVYCSSYGPVFCFMRRSKLP